MIKRHGLLLTALFVVGCANTSQLPLPEVIDGFWATFEVDKNINVFGEQPTLDNYLEREHIIYRDMRMLVDPANYEAIGGDRFLSGFVKGFEVVPLPYIIPIFGLPAEVGATYEGTTLFDYDGDATYSANYHESETILEQLFPKDKTIFIMCGGGGYAMMAKRMLIDMGWDENKIYNVGCYWQYHGANDVKVKITEGEKTYYAFHKVNYHVIDFDYLNVINEV